MKGSVTITSAKKRTVFESDQNANLFMWSLPFQLEIFSGKRQICSSHHTWSLVGWIQLSHWHRCTEQRSGLWKPWSSRGMCRESEQKGMYFIKKRIWFNFVDQIKSDKCDCRDTRGFYNFPTRHLLQTPLYTGRGSCVVNSKSFAQCATIHI